MAQVAQVAVRAPAAAVSAVLPPEFAAVRVARDLVRTALDDWGAESLADDVALVVSELVANALLYGLCLPLDPGPGQTGPAAPTRASAQRPGQIELQMVSTGSHLICTVHDPSPAPPIRRPSDDAAMGGRGLQLIEALSMCWGWTPSNGAKSVWAVFPLDSAAGAEIARARHAVVRRAS